MGDPLRCSGLIYGPQLHHLDHLGPLCVLMHIPLIVTEETIAALARSYYPGLQVICAEYLLVAEYLVSHFEIVFCSLPRDIFDEVFFFAQKLQQKKVHTIWCPHGNSDKGQEIFYMEGLKKEEWALVYGKQMIDFLQRKGVYNQLKGHVVTGNFRYQFYLEHRAFYDALVEKEVLRRLSKKEKTLLYAPTWKDYENSTSFFDAVDPLIKNLPHKYNLIIKLHPNLRLQEEFRVEELIEKYQDIPNLLFLSDFTPIHPLLEIADIYIGDMSSIGYDFLSFDRPLFFLNQNARDSLHDPGLYLFRCGLEVKPEEYADIYGVIERYFLYELRNFSQTRKDVYTYAFGHPKPLNTLKKEILHLIASFPERGLEFF